MKSITRLRLRLQRCLKYSSGNRFLSIVSLFMLIAFLNLTVGCFYYKSTTIAPSSQYAPHLVKMQLKNKFFILHMGDKAWHLNNIAINNDKTELSGTLEKLPSNHLHYLDADPLKLNRYKYKESEVLQEVHIYTSEYTEGINDQINIPLTAIAKIEVYDLAQGATIASWVFSALGILAGVYAVLGIIILLTKTSCPFIYSFDGNHFTFAGEIFSGAIQPGLERHDYMLLPKLMPSDGNYKLKVTNEVKEIQNINLVELILIDHPENIRVLIDKYGRYQTIVNPEPPVTAETFSGKNILSLISEKDSLSYYCDDASRDRTPKEGVILKFANPAKLGTAKLIIRARNSFWLDHLFSSLQELFGSSYDNFAKKQESRKGTELREWMKNQDLPLAVYLEKDGQWVFQDYFEIAGPMAMKDDILTLNLDGLDSETVKVKLETGFLFWEIDHAAIDFTVNVPVKVTQVGPDAAVDENGKSVRTQLLHDDNRYYIQPDVGNAAILTFDAPPLGSENRTIILHSKGFYKILRDQRGIANRATLETFRNPGRMSQYSYEKYEQMMSSATR